MNYAQAGNSYCQSLPIASEKAADSLQMPKELEGESKILTWYWIPALCIPAVSVIMQVNANIIHRTNVIMWIRGRVSYGAEPTLRIAGKLTRRQPL
jgi:hypothetical protein